VSTTGLAPQALGSPVTIFPEVLARLRAEPTQRVLDAPAGRGALVRRLLDEGYEASACDIDPEQFEVEGVECRRANLNERLPYEDASFDAVLSCNGLHRVYALGRAVSEYARVLRRGGRLIVTVPNFSGLPRRVQVLLMGVAGRSIARSGAVVDEAEARFRQPVSLAQILSALAAAGLETSRIHGAWRHPGRRRPGRVLYLPLVLAIRLYAAIARPKFRETCWLQQTSTFPALFSDYLLIEARKP
jgi:SAM-dependent methyltransferase